MTGIGPVGLLALEFRGCEIWAGDQTGDIVVLTITGKDTFRRVAVLREGWQVKGTIDAILGSGRLLWHEGNFVDTFERSSGQRPIPAQWCLRDGARTVLGLTRVYPVVR